MHQRDMNPVLKKAGVVDAGGKGYLLILEGMLAEMRGEPMVIISHQERIISLADEVVVVGDGAIIHRGTADEILPRILADTLSGCPVMGKEAVRK